MNRRALILAYFFVPDTTGGVVRTVKFVKYLTDYGWNSTVVAPDWGPGESDKMGLTGELPAETNVVRAGRALESPWYWEALDRVPYFWRAFRKMRAGIEYPDIYSSWRQPAIQAAASVIEEEKPDVLFSTSPPVTSHYVALKLKRRFGIPWVADFRDPWTDNAIAYANPWQWRKRIDLRLEHAIYRECDLIIANTASNWQTITSKHGVPAEKVMTITNGYDETDFAACTEYVPSKHFRIVYTGSFYGTYNPEHFLKAFQEFLSRENSPDAVFVIAGSACQWVEDNVHDPALLRHVELLGELSHADACQLITESDLLLHVYPPGVSYSVPGKLYEYLGCGRPIVAVCDRPSEVSRLLEDTGHGKAFTHHEVIDMSNYLTQCYTRWCRGEANGSISPDEAIRNFTRRNLASQLADAFDRAINSHAE